MGPATTASTGKATYLSGRWILNAPSELEYSPAGIRQLLESTTLRETKASQFSHLVLADRLRTGRPGQKAECSNGRASAAQSVRGLEGES